MNTNEPKPLPVEPESTRDLLRATLPHIRWLAAGGVHGTADLCWSLERALEREEQHAVPCETCGAPPDAAKLVERVEQKLTEILHIATATRALSTSPMIREMREDDDLDGPWGNPTVRFNPYEWHGPSQIGRAFGDCPPEFLDRLASAFDAFVRKDARDPSKEKRVFINKKLASRARGWAMRIRDDAQKKAAKQGEAQRRAATLGEAITLAEVNDNAADAEFHQYLYATGQIDPYEF